MDDGLIGRRQLFAAGAILSAGLAAAGPATAQGANAPAGRVFTPQPAPLPFDPKSLSGLSEALIVSHHDNNYAGAVRRLGAISAQLAALDFASAPGFQINGLKREELIAWNSMILHEIYFSGLGAPGRPGTPLAQAIERDFGSDARWRTEFSGMGKALGGGSGWVLLTWSPHDRRLTNQWASDHSTTLAGGVPILALDMYEHAYAMDYGSRAAAYVDAFMAMMNWAAADARFARVAAG